MSCIKDDLVQKYIDGEASSEELVFIQEHLSTCDDCTMKVEERERLVNSIKTTLNILNETEVDIPPFIFPENHKRKRRIKFTKYALAISAASILILFLFLVRKDDQQMDCDLMYVNSFENEFDANRTISQQEMVINIIDAKGKVSEFHIE